MWGNIFVFNIFKHVSLGQYVQAFQTHPNNPLHSLCVGLTFFHMASQKYVGKRHTLVLQVRCLFHATSFSFTVTSRSVFNMQHMYVFRVSPSCGGTWSCVESAKRACTTWAERCTRWASHIWPYITTRRRLHSLHRNWRSVCIRQPDECFYSDFYPEVELHPQLFCSPIRCFPLVLSCRVCRTIRWIWRERSPSTSPSSTRRAGMWRWPGSSSTRTALFESAHKVFIVWASVSFYLKD